MRGKKGDKGLMDGVQKSPERTVDIWLKLLFCVLCGLILW